MFRGTSRAGFIVAAAGTVATLAKPAQAKCLSSEWVVSSHRHSYDDDHPNPTRSYPHFPKNIPADKPSAVHEAWGVTFAKNLADAELNPGSLHKPNYDKIDAAVRRYDDKSKPLGDKNEVFDAIRALAEMPASATRDDIYLVYRFGMKRLVKIFTTFDVAWDDRPLGNFPNDTNPQTRAFHQARLAAPE